MIASGWPKTSEQSREARPPDEVARSPVTSTLPGDARCRVRGPTSTCAGGRPASATPGFRGGKAKGERALAAGAEQLSELQERLTAAAKGGATHSVLLVVQGMDTGRQGRHRAARRRRVRPRGRAGHGVQGADAEERAHDFLWRIRNALPPAGKIGVFDRSHYEDVLVVRVHDLVPRAVWSRRYATINRFEQRLADSGTTVVKVMLNVSAKEQKQRLADAAGPPGQVVEVQPGRRRRARCCWPDYQEAYQAALDQVLDRGRALARRTRPTTSGTPGGPCSSCSSRRWSGSTRSGRRPRSTSRPRRQRLAAT